MWWKRHDIFIIVLTLGYVNKHVWYTCTSNTCSIFLYLGICLSKLSDEYFIYTNGSTAVSLNCTCVRWLFGGLLNELYMPL